LKPKGATAVTLIRVTAVTLNVTLIRVKYGFKPMLRLTSVLNSV